MNHPERSNSTFLLTLGLTVVAILVLVPWALLHAAQEKEPKPKKLDETYTATALVRARGASAMVSLTVTIEAYSDDDEVDRLAQLLRTQGSDGLLREIRNMKEKGRITPAGRIGGEVKVIRSRRTEKGRLITMVTDRRIAFLEQYFSTRSRDYEFGFLQMEVLDDKAGGEGILLAATKIAFKDDRTIELEHLGIDPVRITNVTQFGK